MAKPWYMFPTVVPFGDTNFDVGLGGPHDTDVQPPPNYPITALLPGTSVDLSAPPWGKQVGIALDAPVNGVPYCAYLHLSAINPALSLQKHSNAGELVGWVGGGNTPADYQGTNNPTGKNFLNTLGSALTFEYTDVNWSNHPIITQQFSNGRIEWNNGVPRAWDSNGVVVTP
jgi:hypothetical protein